MLGGLCSAAGGRLCRPGASQRLVLLHARRRGLVGNRGFPHKEKRPRLRLPGAFQKEATLGGRLERSS